MRLFTGIEIPEDIGEEVCALMGGIPGARWQDRENLHLTLRFLGNLDPHTAEDVDMALSRVASKPFDITLKSMGTFGEPPRVLWAGAEASERLPTLAGKVDSALHPLRLDYDRRKFIPHVTLARLRNAHPGDLAGFIQEHGDYASRSFTVTHFVLYSSHRGQDGADYTPERYYIL